MLLPIIKGLTVVLLCSLAQARRNKYIVPGATWYDTDGEVLSAHAGGIVEVNRTWYWFGQDERQADKNLFSGMVLFTN